MTTGLKDLLERHLERGTIPGAVAILAPADGESEVVAVGASAIEGPPITPDAIFRIQSMTKAITAVAALRLVEAGRVGLDDALDEWMPELRGRRVLTSPTAPLDDTVPARRSITLRHLLTNTSGYGGIVVDSPLQRAMEDNGTAADAEPVALGAGEWLARLAELPLAFQPGEGWRYHHSFGILGILISRITGRPTGDHLAEDLFGPLGMVDTGFWTPADQAHRLPAAYRHEGGGLVETEPAGGGFYAGTPPFDVDHAELVSTATDYLRFLRMLALGGTVDGERMLSAEHLAAMTGDQAPARVKTDDSFYPGFWDGMGWGFGVGVQTSGPRAGRYGWSGGQGTDFFVEPDGTIAILLTQVELDGPMFPLLDEFQDVVGE
ncbi:serine hydrolase [Agromyces sp. LHK192]|uniref:serine hydrolase domain-containing protein n=1 Tax=Agromyces sp. LHK192 TaxID=2498704 RepID=UPI000FDA718D|nr:serine hydrolase domain-containing protein [Agromyces sp. LHK192]